MEICTKTTYQIVVGNAVTICDVFWYGFCFGEIRRTATTSLSQLDLKKSYFYCIYKEGWKENSVCRVWKECLDINIAGLRTQRYAVPSPSVDTFSPDALSRNERSKPTLAEKPPKEEDKRSLEEDLVYTGTIEEERSGSPRCYKNSRQTRLGVAFALSSSVRVFFSTSWNSFHFRSVCPLNIITLCPLYNSISMAGGVGDRVLCLLGVTRWKRGTQALPVRIQHRNSAQRRKEG